MEANKTTENPIAFKQNTLETLSDVRYHLQKAMEGIEEASAFFEENSPLYCVLLGSILPKVREADRNNRGKLSISDIILLIERSGIE